MVAVSIQNTPAKSIVLSVPSEAGDENDAGKAHKNTGQHQSVWFFSAEEQKGGDRRE
ncbi:hypothetical protein [Ensifer aridi]|uniref:hypothetical protein n=1 Tax=Ensifer aridi TaxID=1708715 RepID=UPI00358DF0AD